MNKALRIKFCGNDITVIAVCDGYLVALKPIARALGLHWGQQTVNLKKDPVLSKFLVMHGCPTAGGIRRALCLPLDFLNDWLFKIRIERYKDERRELIVHYRMKCYQALTTHLYQADEELRALFTALQEERYFRAIAELELECTLEWLDAFSGFSESLLQYGEISDATGLPKDLVVKPHCRSMVKTHLPAIQEAVQLLLPLQR